MNLVIKAIQRQYLGWDGNPTDWIPVYVQRDAKTLVLPKRVSISCVPQAYEGNTVYGYPILVHTEGSGTYPMVELDFMKSGDERWLEPRYTEFLTQCDMIKVLRPMVNIAVGFSFGYQDVEVVQDV